MKIKDIFKFIISIIMFFGGSIVIGLFLRNLGMDLTNIDAKDESYIDCLIYGIYSLIIFLLYHKTFKEDFNKIKADKKFTNTLFKYFAIFFGIKVASAMVTGIIGTMFGMEIGNSENQEALIKMLQAGPIMMLISSSIFAPLVEEGIFRLSLKKVISNKKVFIILSGLIFGFMHIFPTDLSISVALTYSISYVSIGIALAYMYIDTDNIWYPICIHGLNNFLSLILIILM